MTDQKVPDYDVEGLIRTAFETARNRGKPDWFRMNVSVVKNRFLQMTRGRFDERSHNANSIRELLQRYPHLVLVDDKAVELREEQRGMKEDPESRIRPDLWRATMDYSSGSRYAWDPGTREARLASSDDKLILPTIDASVMAQWREEFAARAPNDSRVARWSAEVLGTQHLPPDLRHQWNRFVHSKVAALLRNWFATNQIKDVEFQISRPQQVDADSHSSESLDGLRQLVIACVRAMTREELAELRVSPVVLYRAIQASRK